VSGVAEGVAALGVAAGVAVGWAVTVTAGVGATGWGCTVISTLGVGCTVAGLTSLIVVLFLSITVDLFSLTVPTALGTMIGVVAGRLFRKYASAPPPTAKKSRTVTITALELPSLLTLVVRFSETLYPFTGVLELGVTFLLAISCSLSSCMIFNITLSNCIS
jgi:hypothetical protein